MANIPHLLLAAGGSQRMGQPKQLLPWRENTLIENQIQTLLKTGQIVTVVIGAYADKILPILEKLPVLIFMNNEWAKGMGNSLSQGIKMLGENLPSTDGVLISLLDQPLVTADYLNKMISLFQPGTQQIITSQSASGWIGVPTLFDRIYFEELQKLNGEEGAKKLIQKHKKFVKTLKNNALGDMDTPEAYQKFLRNR